jgi:hypothetical protein
MERPTDFFRKALKEFRTADDLLSNRLKAVEIKASAEQAEMTGKAEEAERAATGYLRAIEAENSPSVNFDDIRISPQIDGDFSALKNLVASASENKKELERINDRIESLKGDLKEALLQEERERQALEQARQEALLKAAADRRKRKIRRAAIAAVAVCTLIILHFELLGRTTLSFTISIDEKYPSGDKTPSITLDGKPFASGDNIKLGHHHLSVELKNFEPIEIDFTAFYGAKDLGRLSLILSKGSVSLLSEPPDAEFDLSGNWQHWQGNLPIRIDDVPVGTYQLVARRKGWELNQDVVVSRGSITTNKTEFQYGSVKVTSDPAGFMISTNGVEIGKTPMVFQEIIPGRYTFSVSDGENDLTADLSVAPKGSVEHTFVFHYSAVQLSSSPSGAAVIRKGKEIGKTPLTLNRIPAGETTIGLQLQDYLSTNVLIKVLEDATTNIVIKLISERYIQAMEQAREALDAGQFDQASNSVATAIQSDPADSNAPALLVEITTKAEVWRQQQLAAAQSAADEKSRARAAEFAAISALDPSALINDCWNPADHEATDNVNRTVAAPVEVALNVALSPLTLFGKATGKNMSSTKDINNAIRFNMNQFYQNWQSRTFSYKGVIESIQAKNRVVVFQKVGSYPREVFVTASLTQETVDELQKLKKNASLTIIGEISSLSAPEVMTIGVNSIIFQNSRIYREAPDTTQATNAPQIL